MLQCEQCEFFSRRADGTPHLACDPFSNIKEPECLIKWQTMHLQTLAASHRATLDLYKRMAPLQEKMFRHVEREIDEQEDADSWKYDPEDDEDDPFRV